MTDTESSKMYDYKVSSKHREDHKKYYGTDTIPIYSNDLKYKKYNDIDLNNIKNLDDMIDHDTVEYRIKECISTDGKTLDLSHLNLTKFPKLPNQLIQSVKYLFLSENKLEILDDLKHFEKLSVIDLCHNRLTKLPIMPDRLKELMIRFNQINDITSLNDCYSLRRLDCSHNMITELPNINRLEILICDHNKISNLPAFQNLIRISCASNMIKELPPFPNIEIIECDKNYITKICNYMGVRELYCSNNQITTISNVHKIDTIHCYNNKIKKIDYFENLKELVCDYDDINIASYYTIVNSKVYQNKIIAIYFK
ncbi:leucine-rich repeat protein [Klosneuvirus KNV1]|uniref:Leucine-rich repeat protein n=1 Tax=Klosneuvirus KNV1 TaxID=1977640 RepID=A0A1V0SJC2_9VIRU|nr:leucine-rich repeat protein [Klosneuvirus KNV1]